jgi:hypothetical protein
LNSEVQRLEHPCSNHHHGQVRQESAHLSRLAVGVALVTSGLRGPLINPASSFRSHQGFASFPLIVGLSRVSTTWVMRGQAWNIQPIG